MKAEIHESVSLGDFLFRLVLNCGHVDYLYDKYVININKKGKYVDFNFRIKTLFII